MESQAVTRFNTFSKEHLIKFQKELAGYFQPYDKYLKLHSLLVTWKHKHKKYKKFRDDFCYDGFLTYPTSNYHSILYVFDYKDDDRHARRRMRNMQDFIVRHSFDKEINNSSATYLVLNKTNSKCVNTKEYVKKFEKYILEEIEIIRPTLIVCLGCYEIVNSLFQKYSKNEILSAIKNTPIIDIPPIKLNVNDRLFQLHFEYVYFKVFGWNI